MKTIALLFTLFPFYAMALTLAGQVSIDGEDFEFKKKISLGKESVFLTSRDFPYHYQD